MEIYFCVIPKKEYEVKIGKLEQEIEKLLKKLKEAQSNCRTKGKELSYLKSESNCVYIEIGALLIILLHISLFFIFFTSISFSMSDGLIITFYKSTFQ